MVGPDLCSDGLLAWCLNKAAGCGPEDVVGVPAHSHARGLELTTRCSQALVFSSVKWNTSILSVSHCGLST